MGLLFPKFKSKSGDYRLHSWRPYVLIFVLGFVLYSQTLFFKFTYFDDYTLILEKQEILSNIGNVFKVFSTDAFFSGDKFYYRPLLNLSFLIDYQFGGAAPFIYHLVNVLIHCLAASLVFNFLLRLTRRRLPAFILSLFFLVHPVLVQAVAWVPGRNDSLLAVFVLAAFISFLDFSDRPRLRTYLGYVFFLLAALFTKESAVFLPPLVIGYFLFIDSKSLNRRDKLMIVAGSFAAGVIWFLARTFALENNPVSGLSAFAGIIKNLPAVLLSFGKLILPIKLSVLPILADSSAAIRYGWIALVLLAAALVFSRRKNNRRLIFGAVWFLVFLLPSFIRLNDLPDFLEHRLYLPFVGFLIILAEIDWIKDLNWQKRNTRLAVSGILLILAGLTLNHSVSFQDGFHFWQRAVEDAPHSPLAHRNLGVMYYFNGDNQNAARQYQEALRLHGQEPMAHNNLGVIYMQAGDLAAAEKEFLSELKINPDYDKALSNLVLIYNKQNRPAEAGNYYERLLNSSGQLR